MQIMFHKSSSCLGPDLFEGSLCKQVTLDPGEGLMRIVIGLFYQPQLLPLTLVQTRLHTRDHRHKINNVEKRYSNIKIVKIVIFTCMPP